MKVFLTGGSGFIGSAVLRQLVERGDQVYALARSDSAAQVITAAARAPGQVTPVRAGLFDHESLASAMSGCDQLYHIAGWYRLGERGASRKIDGRVTPAVRINVEGTSSVLRAAAVAGVPRILYTSTIAVFGDTGGEVVGEGYVRRAPFRTDYEKSKWLAHHQIVLPQIAQGLPVIVLQPGVVYGPGDPSLFGDLMRYFYAGYLPFFPGPELTLSLAHADDVAAGHLLAGEHGVPGESYILAGETRTLRQMSQDWARILGRPLPWAYVPARALRPFAGPVDFAGRFLPLPNLISRDGIMILNASFTGCGAKAVKQLGWRSRPLDQGFRETFNWIASQSHQRV